MRKLLQILILYFCHTALSTADLPALRIAVPHFLPPYVMQAVQNKLSGFDIVMMTKLCKIMRRSCTFVPMSGEKLITAVADHSVDLAIGALTITLESYKQVNFTIPYLLSNVRFLDNVTQISNKSAQQDQKTLYTNKKIGVTTGSSFAADLTQIPGMSKKIITFNHSNEMIDALNHGRIDLALMNNETTIYWQNNSAGKLIAVGDPFLLGFGLGIAVNPENPGLATEINHAILIYESTLDFKQLNDIYFDDP